MKKRFSDASTLLEDYSGPLILVDGDETSYVSNIEDPKNHWLYYAFKGFKVLKNHYSLDINHFVTIATGPGIDAIGAMEILNPERITVTDLVPSAIDRARENISRYQLQGKKIPINYLVGNLCEPLGTDKADIIYANIPNIPIETRKRNRLMEGITAASFFDPNTVRAVPQCLNKHLLALQYTFLKQAKKNITPQGMIIINLGVRFPLKIVKTLFDLAGYKYEILHFGFKKQTEPQDTIPGYARYEKDGIIFTYYPYKQAVQTLSGKTIQKVDELMKLLKPLEITSTKAQKLSLKGEEVGHIVTVLGAKPKSH
ncbi:50S ribosomal protein L11 methyltransferase [Candidatus Daviesbacteria bacterium]|nr:50S ribosomal protein L11 methyltransferase [Candidatus Daviesbacteria bacterium]